MRARAFAALIGCTCLMLQLPAAYGQDAAPTSSESRVERARTHFKRGVEHYRDGDPNAALTEFKRAYATAPNFRLLYNLGQVSQDVRDYPAARDYYERYLAEGGDQIDPARRQEVEASLLKIKNRIGTLEISSNIKGAELFVDDVSVGTTPLAAPVEVSAGQRRISASAPGKMTITRIVDVVGDETERVALEFPASAELAVKPIVPHQTVQPSSGGVSSTVVWLGIGTGVLALSAGVMAYLTSRDNASYQDALDRRTSFSELDDLADDTRTKALITDILLAATTAAAASTLVIALLEQSDRGELTLRASPTALTLSGRFQ
jgi:hypothetical protein